MHKVRKYKRDKKRDDCKLWVCSSWHPTYQTVESVGIVT